MLQQPIILFDGVCNFCNSAVNFVIKRDKNSALKFTTLQSNIAHQMLAHQNIPTNDLSSFVFIENEKIYTRSTAALRVCTYLTGLWPLVYGFIIVPKFIRDGIYNWVAKNRYRWFGKTKECMIPTPEIKAKFLNELL
jgi:predicted DCC family thiol-disulfide oxidoreductase YuxK